MTKRRSPALVWVDSREMTPEFPRGTMMSGLRGIARAPVRAAPLRTTRLCALAALFERGFVHWFPPAVRKVPPKRCLKCTKSPPAFGQCAKSRRNTPPSVQSPHRLLREPRSAMRLRTHAAPSSRQGSGCQGHARDGARAAQTSAVAHGFRGRRRIRTLAPIPSDPHKAQETHKGYCIFRVGEVPLTPASLHAVC